MSEATYDVGDLVQATGTFTDAPTGGSAHDPTAVSFTMKEPDGTRTTYVYGTDAEVVRSATGIYYVNWSATQEGRHYYRWFATGTGQAAEEGSFIVRQEQSSA